MINTVLQSVCLSGVYTRFDIENTLTGEVRSLAQAPNKITPQALLMFGSAESKWHLFNYCVIGRVALDEDSLEWGQLIPTNSNPDAALCDLLVASRPNDDPHAEITKVDTGMEMYLEATKSWTFRQGLEGSFNVVMSGLLETTDDVPTVDDILVPTDDLTEPCKLTGDTLYKNWVFHAQSVAGIETSEGVPTEMVLNPVDVLTVTHVLRLQLPKYQAPVVLSGVDLGDGIERMFVAKPFEAAYDALLPTNTPLTRMRYSDSAAMTDGLVPGLRESVTNGSFGDVGTSFITGPGDYSNTEQVTTEDGDVLPIIKHTLTFEDDDGHGEVGYFLLQGAGAWYEVEVTPKIKKRNVDKLEMNFYFEWG